MSVNNCQPRYMHKSLKSSRRLMAVLLLMAGCSASSEHDLDTTSWPAVLQFQSVGCGHHAPLDSMRNTTRRISSHAEWTLYQDSLQPLRPFQPVDFSTQMLILVATPVPSTGYGLRVETVETFLDTTTVTYRVYAPAPDCLVADLPGNVFDVVRLNRHDNPMRYLEETEAIRCSVR